MNTAYALILIPASDIREGDTIRGYYRPGVTVDTAILPDGQFHSDQAHSVGLIGRPYRATTTGPDALTHPAGGRKFTGLDPVIVTREPVRTAKH